MNNTEVAAIILAAGQGTRFNGRKQFLEFHGKPLYKHVYDTLCKVVPPSNIVIVGVDIEGGNTRNESVKIGLEYLISVNSFKKVVICEAARSLVTQSLLSRLN